MCDACLYNMVGVTAKLSSSCLRALSAPACTWWISFFRRGCVLGFKVFMRVLGPVMLTLALGLITSILFTFLFYVVPDITDGNHFIFGLHFVGGMFLLVNVVFNYVACAFTPPGEPAKCQDPAGLMGERIIIVDGKKVRQIRHAIVISPAVSYRYCRHCRCIKPPRAHHDSISGKCVLAMDHYCPWMNNCVGHYNYRHFVLFLLYLFIGALYVVFVTTGYFSSIFPYQRTTVSSAFHANVNTAIIYSYTVGLSAGISVSLLGVWHLYLCLTNQTTIEFYINMEERHEAKQRGLVFKNPFDKGWRKNFARVFGQDVGWVQALMMSLRPPPPSEWPPLPTQDMIVNLSNAAIV